MRKVLGFGLLAIVVGILGVAALIAFYPVPEPNDVAIAESSEVLYADGTPITRLGDVTRTSVPLSSVPTHVRQAVMAAEDRDFYSHDGISPEGIARAVVNNASGDSTQGGSTITQQYVKNAYLTHDQTLIRKARELILSVKVELVVSKDVILENYLNTIYFGRGAYGIEAASRTYFGHPAAELTPSEGVFLAGIIQAPSRFEPETNLVEVEQRFSYVVSGMTAQGWLTPQDAAGLTMPEFIPLDTSNRYGGQTGYIVEQAREELLAAGFNEAQIDAGGLRVRTTIDPAAQEAIVEAVSEEGPQTGTDGLRIGAASVDPRTGGILAMYGGPDYVSSPLNNATQARAQAGSTFKPFALAAAFEADYDLNSRWNGNSPMTISGYTLENEGNTSYGNVSLRRATEQSINTAFVDLTDEIGVRNVINAANRAGLPADTPGVAENLTFVLGSASTTPLEMAGAYATFAARGLRQDPHIVADVTSSTGQVLFTADTRGTKVFDEDIADQVNAALQRVVTNGTATKAQALDRPVAGKTGTTDENKSAWFVGYAPQAATAVMLTKEDAAGNPVTLSGTGGMRKVFGSSFPLSIWVAYNEGYLEDVPEQEFVAPENAQPTWDNRRRWTSPTPTPDVATATPEPTESLAPVESPPVPTPEPDPATPTAPTTPTVPASPPTTGPPGPGPTTDPPAPPVTP